MTTKLAVVDAAQVIHAGIREIVSTTDSIQLVGTWEALEPFGSLGLGGVCPDMGVVSYNQKA
jgi:hypothetical protein